MILLNFIKVVSAKKDGVFPHLGQRGKAGGSSFSPSSRYAQVLSHWRWPAIALGLAVATTAHADVKQQIDQAIQQHLQQMMNAEAKRNGWQGMRIALDNTPLGSTQQLADCAQLPSVNGGSTLRLARQPLTLECSQPHWTLKVSSEMKVFLPVVLSNAVINRGDTISSAMLKREEMDIAHTTRGFYHRIEEVAGMGAKRRMRANQVLSPDLIDQPTAVKRGERVKIIASHDGISAAMTGEALDQGSVGEVIKVKNLSSGKTIEAKVLEVGVVTSTF